MPRFAVTLLALLSSTAASADAPSTRPAPLSPGDSLRRLAVEDRPRSYLLHVPPNYDAKRPGPVVLCFHGATMNAAMMVNFCGLNEKADAANFVVAYANGTGFGETALFFNAWAPAKAEGPPDDVLYTRKLLDDLATVVNVDPKRVFATGMSNGGMMCQRLAAELSDRIAAVAPVAGTIAFPVGHPKRAVPMIYFHGTADTIVPYSGPNPKLPRLIKFLSVDDTMKTWIDLNHCDPTPKSVDLPDATDDGTTVRRITYSPAAKEGAEVVLIQVTGGGHTWPGQPPPVKFIGRSTTDINANDLIWDFFLAHPMK